VTDTVRLQPLTRAKVAALGDDGARWLAALPQVLAHLRSAWSLTFDAALPGGSESYVTRATTRHGQPVVVKVAVTADGFAEEAATLQRAAGRGYARLLDVDLTRNALLLEALGGSLEVSGQPPETQLEILVDTLRTAWQPVGPEARPVPGVDKASQLYRLVNDLWLHLDRPCAEQVVFQALQYADTLRHPPAAALVVLHGDPHPGNALAVAPRPGGETGYCFVDPDGFVGDMAYDLGVTLRDWSSRLGDGSARGTAERYAGLLADRSGVDLARIWQWGFLERVSTGLYVMSFGATALGRRFLDTAERLAG
jgi:streptomycin 6-kinase